MTNKHRDNKPLYVITMPRTRYCVIVRTKNFRVGTAWLSTKISRWANEPGYSDPIPMTLTGKNTWRIGRVRELQRSVTPSLWAIGANPIFSTKNISPLAQSGEQCVDNAQVLGSKPRWTTKQLRVRETASHLSHKQKVLGSTPRLRNQ